jgi:hypothetical protein
MEFNSIYSLAISTGALGAEAFMRRKSSDASSACAHGDMMAHFCPLERSRVQLTVDQKSSSSPTTGLDNFLLFDVLGLASFSFPSSYA